MNIYFDTNIYDFIAETNATIPVSKYLQSQGHKIQASSSNLIEILAIPDSTKRLDQLKVLTTVATSFEPKPQSWHQAMEVYSEIKKLRPYWLRNPVSEALLKKSKEFLKAHLIDWEKAKKLDFPLGAAYGAYRHDFERGVNHFTEIQKEFRQRLKEDDFKYSLVTMNNKKQIREILDGNLSDPELFWRGECLMVWFEAIARKNPSSRDYADWLLPYVMDKSFNSPSYGHFWIENVRSSKVEKNRITSLVSYYQLKKRISHGNPNDQMHACHILDVDLFFTADKSYFDVLQQVLTHFSRHAKIIFVDRNGQSVLEEIKHYHNV